MGSCISSFSGIDAGKSGPTATVISANGELRRHTVPIAVSRVLEMESQAVSSPSSSNLPSKFFVCNSDRLYYDEHITALDLDYELREDQIYFVLPVSKLQYKLSASDMAALAVKASVAFQSSPSDSTKRSSFLQRRSRNGKPSKYSRISPVMEEFDSSNQKTVNQRVSPSISKVSSSEKSTAGLGVSRSGSVRKLHKYSSRRAKLTVRSFRMKLNTIYEGSVLHLY